MIFDSIANEKLFTRIVISKYSKTKNPPEPTWCSKWTWWSPAMRLQQRIKFQSKIMAVTGASFSLTWSFFEYKTLRIQKSQWPKIRCPPLQLYLLPRAKSFNSNKLNKLNARSKKCFVKSIVKIEIEKWRWNRFQDVPKMVSMRFRC